jgi:hypothetical protein
MLMREPVVENLHDALVKLANECDNYESFREKALARTPDVFKPSIGPHLLEWYVEFRDFKAATPDPDKMAD